ncbi:helix-turn-helix domain-containing protein [Paenibacillus fonticola]|uniref:helix-turn-helix domain-containing protein n=1 Tax=Paenibacillus fonticola TaxID=379896 RepID=UPI0003717079|nr:helix-turn-helix domain-containing protein [Paenibacillus fonticola]
MYRAMLVDDENFDLVGMQKLIPWSSLEIDVVYSTSSSLAALDYVHNHEIDILITDIKMPVMSGIELARLALEVNPQLKTVFISGYQNFDFAKQALQLKADGYILKPIDDNEIISTLQEVVAGLSVRLHEKSDNALLNDFDFIRNDFLLHLLEGTIDEITLAAFLRKYPMDLPSGKAHAVIVEIDDVINKRGGSGEQEDLHHIYELLEAYISARQLGHICRLTPNRLGIIYLADPSSLQVELEGLLAEIRAKTDCTATVAYGRLADVNTELPVSYREAVYFISCKMFFGKDRVIDPGEARQFSIKSTKDVNTSLDELFQAITSYELVAICDVLEELFESVKKFAEPVKVYHFSRHLIARFEGYLKASGRNVPASAMEGWSEESLAYVEKFETIEEIKSWLRRRAFELSEMLHMSKQKSSWKLLSQIEFYVRTHLSRDITLKETAAHFAYSPNHFGVLFKEQTGMSFNDFVVQERMERAKKLLQSPSLKVYEVAEEVGYRSLTYFSRTFREMFGITPGEYRKQV